MEPLVSILIPAYNAEKWIDATIRSALAQTWQRKEIIIIDDGSTDRTLEIVRQFASDSVHVVSQANQGAARARNNALSLSQGDYIQWLDADDLLEPDKITKQMKAASVGGRRKILLSSSFGTFMHRPNQAKFTPTALWCDLQPVDFLVRKLGQKVHMQTATWLVSRELTEAAGPWNTNMLSDDDGEYFCRVLLASEGVRFVGEAKVYYRSVGTGTLSYIGRSNEKLVALWGSMQSNIGLLRRLEESERVRVACVRYLQNYVVDFYATRRDIFEEMKKLANDLGGRLEIPRLSWKYSWIKTLLGWNSAQRAQLMLPAFKWSVVRTWDEVLFCIESRRSDIPRTDN
jgi:glycosyltransferase involved in cell wall biosynthesis